MSNGVVPSAALVNDEMYPLLNEEQIQRMRLLGRTVHLEPGEVLYEPGDEGVALYLLLTVSVEIVQPDLGVERPITVLSPRMFTGEAGMIGGQRAVVLARVLNKGEAIKVGANDLRALVVRDPLLSEVLLKAFILRRLMLVSRQLGNVTVVGSQHSAHTARLREFLAKTGHPYNFVDLDIDRGSQALIDAFTIHPNELPVVICNGKAVLRNPSTSEVAERLGLNDDLVPDLVRDVIIVGAGPAGLAAAVYAASEGLKPLLIESHTPGGQAGASSKIENYLGFPTGVSGQELASNAVAQARKFGTQVIVAQEVVALRCDKQPYEVVLGCGTSLLARTIVIATGASYTKPDLPALERYEGCGVHYGATHLEAQQCQGEEVVIVGGGNSAGQAAIFLAQTAKRVFMLIRSEQLSATMSSYLVQRILSNEQIVPLCRTELTNLTGDEFLQQVSWSEKPTGQTQTRDVRHIFIMAGASPNSRWLHGSLALDAKGFILTGRDLPILNHAWISPPWLLKRSPHSLESSLPGVFAVGDVRAGSTKRVASAVGEGAIAVSLIHRVLHDAVPVHSLS